MANSPPIPLQDEIAVPTIDRAGLDKDQQKMMEFFNLIKWTISDPWVKWFQSQTQSIEAAAIKVGAASLTAQSASIGATQIPSGSLNTGIYRLTYYFRITSPGTTSSLSVSFGWTDSGVACSKTFTANTGNTTGTTSSDSYLVSADQATPITYATTYASTGAAMQYKLVVTLESINV
jgi:hypothetical protein